MSDHCDECDDSRRCWMCRGAGWVTWHSPETCDECGGSGVCLSCLVFQRVTAEEAARITNTPFADAVGLDWDGTVKPIGELKYQEKPP